MMRDYLQGHATAAYRFFGAHPDSNGCQFRVYAPKARRVWLICSHNGWEPIPMDYDFSGFYALYAPGAAPGDMYKFRIEQADGRIVDKADPYGVQMELRPKTASIINRLDGFKFTDAVWMHKRDIGYNIPLNIYELHCGSWRQKPHDPNQKEDFGWLNYRELAKQLIPYLKENHFTHVELLPLSEHPFDGSWGYQVSGFYAVTSRYGTPQDFMAFVDACHANGIGVILDFVPVHFVTDEFSLIRFDGTPLYEYEEQDIAYSQWGSCNFDYYKPTVRSFLISAACFWLEHYHVDGLRMDAISNVLYWQGDMSRGINIGGVQFLKELNYQIKQRFPNVMLIAEDSTNFLKVTAPVHYDGLGFDYKWDMGWMNDTLDFFRMPPAQRCSRYHQLSFSMMYFSSELYLLPFSHDEVVHGKATIMQKMWGNYQVKFPQCRTLYAYMFTHPGKKLNFMGNEIGHFREWDEKVEVDWFLQKYPLHDSFHQYFRRLCQLYQTMPALYMNEYDPTAFSWLEVDAPEACVYAYRRSANGQTVITVLNLSDRSYAPFYVGVDAPCAMREVLNSDAFCWSGEGMVNEGVITTEKKAHKGRSYRFAVKLAPFSASILEVIPPKQSQAKTKK